MILLSILQVFVYKGGVYYWGIKLVTIAVLESAKEEELDSLFTLDFPILLAY